MSGAEDFAGWTITPEDDGFHDDFEGSDHPWWMETFWTSLEDLRDQIDEALDRLSDLYDALDEEEALPPTEEQTKEAP